MAYADKLTTMRRMALIDTGVGNISWEGVNIEGVCVLKKVDIERNGITIKVIQEKDLKEFCEDDIDYPLKCNYQDPKDEGHWEPRRVEDEI